MASSRPPLVIMFPSINNTATTESSLRIVLALTALLLLLATRSISICAAFYVSTPLRKQPQRSGTVALTTTAGSDSVAVVAAPRFLPPWPSTFLPTPISTTSSPSPSSKSTLSTSTFISSPTTTASTSTLLTPTSSTKTRTNNNPQHRLFLDEQGNLRLGDNTVLLNGLTPTVWTASRPEEAAATTKTTSSSDNNGVFLHTNYEQERPIHYLTLGELCKCEKMLAVARLTRYWMGPKFGTNKAQDVPFDTQFLLLQISDDTYSLILPLVDNGFRASLMCNTSNNNFEVTCAAESGDAAVKRAGMRALYVTVGPDPFALIQQAFETVANTTKTFDVLRNKKLPKFVDQFGWCTWDAFYSKVTPEGVLQGVQALREAGVPPQTIILDDGWQQVTPEPPVQKKEEDEEAQLEATDSSSKPVKVSQVIKSLLDNLLNIPVKFFYEIAVRKAPHGSFGNRIWSFLSRTVLKSSLWSYFDTETDFNRQLSGFPANAKFENGTKRSLKMLVSELKTKHKVQNVLAWHALHGYWRGVSPELGRQHNLNVTNVHPVPSKMLLRLEPQLEWDPVSLFGVGLLSDKAALAKFYELLHAPLVEAGVDGVKVDVQSGVSAVGGGVGGGPHLAKIYVNAMENSVTERFRDEDGGVNQINCMCHSTENLYRYKSTSVARASDDFYPERPESHSVHLVNVAYNSLFLGEICLPDWDMFHSLHESAGLHAAARAVGGCPVYVSDAPGKHDAELLRKLVLPDGSVLRAQLPGRPTRDCLFTDVGQDEESALKIWNQNPSGAGVVGAMNVQGVAWNFETHENEVVNPTPPSVTAKVKPHDVETLRNTDGPFVALRHRTSTLKFLETGETVTKIKLNPRDWEIFTIAPVQISDSILWAPIGLADMLNTGGAVLEAGDIEKCGASTSSQIVSRGPGRFVGFTNQRPSNVLCNGTRLPFSHDQETCELSFMLPSESPNGAEYHVTVVWD